MYTEKKKRQRNIETRIFVIKVYEERIYLYFKPSCKFLLNINFHLKMTIFRRNTRIKKFKFQEFSISPSLFATPNLLNVFYHQMFESFK